MDWETPYDMVPVPRRLLTEVLADGTCPLHIRVKLKRAMMHHKAQQVECPQEVSSAVPQTEIWNLRDQDSPTSAYSSAAQTCQELRARLSDEEGAPAPLAEHTCTSQGSLQWSLTEETSGQGPQHEMPEAVPRITQSIEITSSSLDDERSEALSVPPVTDVGEAEDLGGGVRVFHQQFELRCHADGTHDMQVLDSDALHSIPEADASGPDSNTHNRRQRCDSTGGSGNHMDRVSCVHLAETRVAEDTSDSIGISIHKRLGPCILLIAQCLPLAEVLAARACSHAALDWVMHRASPHLEDDLFLPLVTELGALSKVHDRIRTRLWIQRTAELNRDNSDETTFETQVRSFANDALRRRMEAEMAEAKLDMERQIHAFQVEVDRRMEEQAHRVHAIVEERVQQQLDGILATEMEKVRALVEERVQSKVRAVVQREVHATVCEMQVRLAVLARENDRLRTAFLEHLDHSDLCLRSLVWALSPIATGFFARSLRLVWFCQRKVTQFCAWLLGLPPDRRRERLRTRLEAIRRTAGGNSESEGRHENPSPDGLPHSSSDPWGLELDGASRQLNQAAAAASSAGDEGGGIGEDGDFEGTADLEQPLLAMALRMASEHGTLRRDSVAAATEAHSEEGASGAAIYGAAQATDPESVATFPAGDAASATEGGDSSNSDGADGLTDITTLVGGSALASPPSHAFPSAESRSHATDSGVSADADSDQAGLEEATDDGVTDADGVEDEDQTLSTSGQAAVNDDEYLEPLDPSVFVHTGTDPYTESIAESFAQRPDEMATDDEVFEDAFADLQGLRDQDLARATVGG